MRPPVARPAQSPFWPLQLAGAFPTRPFLDAPSGALFRRSPKSRPRDPRKQFSMLEVVKRSAAPPRAHAEKSPGPVPAAIGPRRKLKTPNATFFAHRPWRLVSSTLPMRSYSSRRSWVSSLIAPRAPSGGR